MIKNATSDIHIPNLSQSQPVTTPHKMAIPKRMTANPVRPARHRAGKPTTQAQESSSEEDSGQEDEEEEQKAPAVSKPTASSFPARTSAISSNLKQVDLNAQKPAPADKPEINEEEFETEESEASGVDGSESGTEEEEESDEDESSSEDEVAKRKLLRPVFIRKGERKDANGAEDAGPKPKTADELWAEEESRRKSRADAMIQEQLEKQAQARAAGKKSWDDEDNIVDDVDDTDNVDPEAELAAWKLREFTRVKRERDILIAAEKEREEVERRRNLTKEEREYEDQIFLDKQKEEKDGKGKMGFMQKYYHKGAFFTEDLETSGLANRDIMGGRYEDDVNMREALPEYMQIRDMTKLGKKSGTKYKDMRSEDTGRWGDHLDREGPKRDDGNYRGGDERFRPDYGRDHEGASGANASVLGERKRPPPDGERGEDKRARVV